MSNTPEDFAYQDYLHDFHEQYIKALEDFASSEDLDQLRKNLKNLDESASEFGSEENKQLKKALKEVATLNSLYSKFMESEKRGRRRYIVGTVLTIVGLILTIVGIWLTVVGAK